MTAFSLSLSLITFPYFRTHISNTVFFPTRGLQSVFFFLFFLCFIFLVNSEGIFFHPVFFLFFSFSFLHWILSLFISFLLYSISLHFSTFSYSLIRQFSLILFSILSFSPIFSPFTLPLRFPLSNYLRSLKLYCISDTFVTPVNPNEALNTKKKNWKSITGVWGFGRHCECFCCCCWSCCWFLLVLIMILMLLLILMKLLYFFVVDNDDVIVNGVPTIYSVYIYTI